MAAGNFKLYEHIKQLKREVRADISKKRITNILNPNLGESETTALSVEGGLIDDFEELAYDYDLMEDE